MSGTRAQARRIATFLLLVAGAGCTGELEADVCTRAAGRVAACLGVAHEQAAECDVAQAARLLEMSCDEIAQEGVRYSDPFGFLCQIFPRSFFCPTCERAGGECTAVPADADGPRACEQGLGPAWSTYPLGGVRDCGGAEACCVPPPAPGPSQPDAAPLAPADAAATATADAGSPAGDRQPDAAPVVAPPDAGVPDAAGPWPCEEVAHIGDSLTAYTIAPLGAAYLAVGATADIDAFGGRAIKQKLSDDPRTGLQAAAAFRAAGFSGCWVVALGTNDTANVAAGAWYTRAQAIDEMMAAIDPDGAAPVLWVNAFTTRTTGYYANANMILWNRELVAAQARWPNLRVFDWAAVAATGVAPFSDGIHHTAAGSDVRNEAIADALVTAYPPPSP